MLRRPQCREDGGGVVAEALWSGVCEDAAIRYHCPHDSMMKTNAPINIVMLTY
jgi:hypothetical protein